jgi:hypothetical protein
MKNEATLIFVMLIHLCLVERSTAAGLSDNYTVSAVMECGSRHWHYVLRKVGHRLFESYNNTGSGHAYLANQTISDSDPGVSDSVSFA